MMLNRKLLFERIRMTMSYYAVANGRSPGVYTSWAECKSQVDRYSGASFKKFPTLSEANAFIQERGNSQSSYSNNNNYNNNIRPSNAIAKNINPYYSSNYPSSHRTYSSAGVEFERDSDGRVDIYTDGACSSNGCGHAKAGIGVYFGDDHPANVSKPVRGRQTNNNAEIQAVTEAGKISQAYGLEKIRINTDSEFLINCMTKWMPKWKKAGWKTANKKPVINKEELEEMEQVLEPLDVEFKHVPGHAGIDGNEKADELARMGANMN